MQHFPPSSIYCYQNVRANFSLWTANLKTTSLTFPSVTPRTAVSSCWTYGCPLDPCLPPIFHSWQPHCAPAATAQISLSARLQFKEKLCSSCLFWFKWFMHGKGRATFLIPTQGSSSETNTGCQIQLRKRTFHCGGNRAAFGLSSFRFWGAPDSWDWTLTWPTCHVWLVWTLSASVCVVACVSEWVFACGGNGEVV